MSKGTSSFATKNLKMIQDVRILPSNIIIRPKIYVQFLTLTLSEWIDESVFIGVILLGIF